MRYGIFELLGNERQNNAVANALDHCNYPFASELRAGLAANGKDKIPVEFWPAEKCGGWGGFTSQPPGAGIQLLETLSDVSIGFLFLHEAAHAVDLYKPLTDAQRAAIIAAYGGKYWWGPDDAGQPVPYAQRIGEAWTVGFRGAFSSLSIASDDDGHRMPDGNGFDFPTTPAIALKVKQTVLPATAALKVDFIQPFPGMRKRDFSGWYTSNALRMGEVLNKLPN